MNSKFRSLNAWLIQPETRKGATTEAWILITMGIATLILFTVKSPSPLNVLIAPFLLVDLIAGFAIRYPGNKLNPLFIRLTARALQLAAGILSFYSICSTELNIETFWHRAIFLLAFTGIFCSGLITLMFDLPKK